MEKTALLQYLTCPLTKLIFCDPVLADDGYFYEFMAIKNHLNRNNVSPVTGEKIGTLLLRATSLKKMADEFVATNPEYASDRFLFRKPFYLFTKEFLDLLRDGKYDLLKEFTSIVLNTDVGKDTLFTIVCKNCPAEVTKYIIDNSIDYDVQSRNGLKPLHTACKYAGIEVIMHLANKGVDVNSEDMNGETPLGYLLLYRGGYDKIVPDFLNLGVDVNKMNKAGYTPAHYIVNKGDLEMLKVFLDHNLNISLTSPKLGIVNLLQYAFKESTSQELIKYLIDLNLNLDVDVDPKTSSEQLIYYNTHLSKKQKQELVLLYLTKLLNRPIVIEDFIATMKSE